MSEKEEVAVIKDRYKKLDEIRKLKINPYPYSFNKKNNASEILEKYKKLKPAEHTKDKVSVAGRLMTARKMGKISFAHLQEESGRIQLLFKEENGKEIYNLFNLLDAGDIVGVEGIIFTTKTGEITIEVQKLSLLCKSLYPLPEKYHGIQDPELKYRKRYLDLIMDPEKKKIFSARAKIISAVREFLDKKGFVEVETPILQPIYGGANARPFKTHHNALDIDLYLKISPELYLKRLLVGGFEKVYEITKNFRNEGIDKTHNPEFTMLEFYQAYADYNEMMEMFEELYIHVAQKVIGATKFDYQGKKIDLKKPWKRISMIDAIKEFAKIDVTKYDDEELRDLVNTYNLQIEGDLTRGTIINALFEELVEEKLTQPTFIIDHPKETSPLTKVHRKNPALIERFEPFINSWEVGNAYSELNDPVEQNKRLKEQAEQLRAGFEEAQPMDEDFVRAIEHGMPPTGGVGVGIDRMVMLFTNSATIRDVILFPTMKPEKN